jgi:hypothetical protein
MKSLQINNTRYQIADNFQDFTFLTKESSNVLTVGYYRPAYNRDYTVVVQFHNGGTYRYDDVSLSTIQGAVHCESIGKYYRSEISGKHTGTKLQEQVLTKVGEGVTSEAI